VIATNEPPDILTKTDLKEMAHRLGLAIPSVSLVLGRRRLTALQAVFFL
jgi:hypothetical protein